MRAGIRSPGPPTRLRRSERLRLEAAERFARDEKTEAIARELRVTARSVRRWRRAWEQGGTDALRSMGPVSVERLSPRPWERLERELGRGPPAHGWDDEFQGWTLKRVKLLIGRMFHVGNPSAMLCSVRERGGVDAVEDPWRTADLHEPVGEPLPGGRPAA